MKKKYILIVIFFVICFQTGCYPAHLEKYDSFFDIETKKFSSYIYKDKSLDVYISFPYKGGIGTGDFLYNSEIIIDIPDGTKVEINNILISISSLNDKSFSYSKLGYLSSQHQGLDLHNIFLYNDFSDIPKDYLIFEHYTIIFCLFDKIPLKIKKMKYNVEIDITVNGKKYYFKKEYNLKRKIEYGWVIGA